MDSAHLPSYPSPNSSALPSPGVAGEMIPNTGPASPVLSDWFFCLLKDKVKEGERLAKLGCCSALPLDAVYNCYFRGGRDGDGKGESICQRPKRAIAFMSMRKSHL